MLYTIEKYKDILAGFDQNLTARTLINKLEPLALALVDKFKALELKIYVDTYNSNESVTALLLMNKNMLPACQLNYEFHAGFYTVVSAKIKKRNSMTRSRKIEDLVKKVALPDLMTHESIVHLLKSNYDYATGMLVGQSQRWNNRYDNLTLAELVGVLYSKKPIEPEDRLKIESLLVDLKEREEQTLAAQKNVSRYKNAISYTPIMMDGETYYHKCEFVDKEPKLDTLEFTKDIDMSTEAGARLKLWLIEGNKINRDHFDTEADIVTAYTHTMRFVSSSKNATAFVPNEG